MSELLKKARAKGRAREFNYPNSEDEKVFFEFVGVMDLVRLDTLCEADEVWYEIKKYMTPMERKDKLIPSDERLLMRT